LGRGLPDRLAGAELQRDVGRCLGPRSFFEALRGEHVLCQEARHRATPHQKAALQVAFEAVARQVRTAHQRGTAVHDKQFGVHRRAGRPDRGRPAQPPTTDLGERLRRAVELRVVDVALEQHGDLDTATGSGVERGPQVIAGHRRVADEKDLPLRLLDEVGQHRQGQRPVDGAGNLTGQHACTTGGQATFQFTGGQTYLIMVGQYTGCCSPGPFKLTLTPSTPPPPAFLGYLSPLPGTILKRSDAEIAVAFRLGDAQGTPLSDEEAIAVATKVTISANSSGSPVLMEDACRYNARKDRYQCSLETPAMVLRGHPYYLAAYRQSDAGWVVVQPGSSASTPNPEIVYFK